MRFFFLAILLLPLGLQAQNGAYQWARSFGGQNADYVEAVVSDTSGNVYVAGSWYGTVDFDPGTKTANLTSKNGNRFDIFIQKFDKNGNLLWVKSVGSNDNDYVNDMAIDHTGNLLLTGSFKATADFDPGSSTHNLTSPGGNDIFILKLNSNGQFVWAKSIGRNASEIGYGIDTDAKGNVLVTGAFIGTVDFNPGTGRNNLVANTGGTDVFVLKLSPAGNYVWAKSFGGTRGDIGKSIATDAQGSCYLTGEFQSRVDFNPGTSIVYRTSTGFRDIFVEKLDSNGNFAWVAAMGSSRNDDLSRSIATDPSGNVYTTGEFYSTVDFDPSASTMNVSSHGARDAFIQKLSSTGAFIYAKAIGGTRDDIGRAIETDAVGNVYLTGAFTNTVDFDPSSSTFNLVSKGRGDVFIQKLNSAGNFVWAKALGGNGDDYGKALTAGKNGSVLTVGNFADTTDLNPGTAVHQAISKGSTDIYLLKLDSCVSTSYTDTIVACDSLKWTNGVTYTSNNYTAVDTVTNAGGCKSIVTLHLNIKRTTYGTDTVSSCVSYTWINGQTYTSNNSTAKDTLKNALGCDSIVSLNLSILSPTYATDSVSACSSYTWINGTTYTSSNSTAKDTLRNSLGCDSIISLNLTILPPSHSTDTVIACNAHKWINGVTYTSNNNTATDTLVNRQGCDSIVRLNLSIVSPDSTVDSVMACPPFTWINGMSYNSNNYSASHKLSNRYGCDSIVYLKLSLYPTSNTVDSIQACREYTWKGKTYTQSTNTPKDTLQNSFGCDSIINLHLVITKIDTTTTYSNGKLISNSTGASYQWLNCASGSHVARATAKEFSPAVNGSYKVHITKNGCLDSSRCVEVTTVGLTTTELFKNVSIYPNPSRGFVILDLAGMTSVSLKLYNANGQLILEQDEAPNRQQLEFPQASGIYFLQLNSQEHHQSYRLLIH